MTYGALTIQEEETQQVASFKKTVAVVFAATCLVGAVVAMSTVAANRSASAVNANRHKGTLAAVPGVEEKTLEVLNMTTYNLRFAIFSFLPCCTLPKDKSCNDCKMIPVVQGKASSDWGEDFQGFVNGINDMEIAAAVYNFEYFTGPKTTEIKPILITYASPDASEKALARAGYYLGSVILATEGVHEHYPLTEKVETYQKFCTNVMNVDPAMCAMEGDFRNCPFENAICGDPKCDSASFSNPDVLDGVAGQGIEDECCELMEEYCNDPETWDDAGCHPTRLRAVNKLCQAPDADEVPESILPDDEEETCADKCANPCAFLELDEENLSYKMCSACATNNLMDAEQGFVAQCYPGAVGFVDKRCCGMNPSCGAEDAQSEFMCGTMDSDELNCVFALHRECPEIVRAQQYEVAPIGCCDMVPDTNQMDCEGEFAEGDCPEPEEEGE